MKEQSKFLDEAFAISTQIRYIALYDGENLTLKQKSGISNESSSESDKYEELLVNPTLIKIASQRGNIDCGGLKYLVIRYGNFFVLLFPTQKGHLNFGLEPDADALTYVQPLSELMKRFGFE